MGALWVPVVVVVVVVVVVGALVVVAAVLVVDVDAVDEVLVGGVSGGVETEAGGGVMEVEGVLPVDDVELVLEEAEDDDELVLWSFNTVLSPSDVFSVVTTVKPLNHASGIVS